MADIRENRKAITLNPILIEIISDEIKRRGWTNGYSAIIAEALTEKFSKEFRVKQLEHEKNQAKFQQ